MRSARRWTQQDLDSLDQRQRGHVSVPPPPLSPEAREIRIAMIRATKAKLEALFAQHLTWKGMRSLFQGQVKFHPERRWLFDFFADKYSLAVELHGGTYANGYHVRGQGFHNDREKINAASEMGITVLEFTKEMIEDGIAVLQTERLLVARGWVKHEQPNV